MRGRNRGVLFFNLMFFLLMLGVADAQEIELIIRGKVLEKGTRKPLEGIAISFSDGATQTAISARDGSFRLSVNAPGNYTLEVTGIGYDKPRSVTVVVDPGKPAEATFYLEPVYSMMEVVIQEDRNEDKTAKTVMTGQELLSVPGSFGDPLRGMQALPGITTSTDESSNPAIRGSGPHDNAYYVDFMPVGYIFHMGGMQSVFNADLVDNFNIYSSAFGPEFANVTGGVIDVQLREPRADRLGGKLNLSMLESDALVEGPVSKNGRFYIAARRSYMDLFMSDYTEDGVEFRQFPRFYDYQGKYIWNISPDRTLTMQFSGARDEMELTLTAANPTVMHDPVLEGNLVNSQEYHEQSIVLDSRLSPQTNSRIGFAHLKTLASEQLTQLGHESVSEDSYLLRNHFKIAAGKSHDILAGVDYTYSRVKLDIDAPKTMPSDFSTPVVYTGSERFTNNDSIHYQGLNLALKDRWKVREYTTVILGGHGSYEDYFGRYRFEPRLGVEYVWTGGTLFTAAWGKYHQVAQGNEIINNGGNPKLGYLEADHYATGVERQISGGYSARLEGYFKSLENLSVPHQPENYINGGSGRAYGAELLIKKKRTTDWTGWLALAYSKTERRNDLTGESFDFQFDQPLIVNLVYEWYFAPKWTFGAKWRYQSGAPFTPVINSTPVTDSKGNIRYLPVYGAINSERLPDYHRLDLRIKRDFLFNTWKMSGYLDVINAYARENVSGYEYNENFTTRKPIEQLPFMLSLGIQIEY